MRDAGDWKTMMKHLGTKFANILHHLQRALHLHQAEEWCAVLGQRTPARREEHLGGLDSVLEALTKQSYAHYKVLQWRLYPQRNGIIG